MKKLSFFASLAILSMTVCFTSCGSKSAEAGIDDIMIDNIWYHLNGEEVQVTSNPEKYTGAIEIPASVTYEGVEYAVTNIGERAFDDCDGMTSVTIPESVTAIGEFAFTNCSGLTSISIPESVTSIGRYAFAGTPWYDMQPDGVVYAGKVAYRYKGIMPEGTQISINEGTLGIAGSAFEDFSGLTAVTIPESVTCIGDKAFFGCSNLSSIEVESGNSIYDSRDNSNAIIETETNTLVEGSNTTVIPGSVTSIGFSAFAGRSGLTAITIPASVTCIDGWAFAGCNGLTTIKVAEGNANYDSPGDCNAIIDKATNTLIAGCQNTVIPESVTAIATGAFQNCTGLTAVTIPASVTNIGKSAFSGCTGLSSINIPANVTEIGEEAFFGCSGLTSIKVEEGNADYNSQGDCNAIIETATNTLITGCQTTVIPEGVTSIGDYAFYNCTGLTSMVIPAGVTDIGGHAFFGCSGITSVTIPESVTTIGDMAFDGCSSLTAVTIPEGVTSIGYQAFWGCTGLTDVTIPETVTSIGFQAFYYCRSLKDVYCRATTLPQVDGDVFNDFTATLHVPAVAVEDYKASELWNKFNNIVTE